MSAIDGSAEYWDVPEFVILDYTEVTCYDVTGWIVAKLYFDEKWQVVSTSRDCKSSWYIATEFGVNQCVVV